MAGTEALRLLLTWRHSPSVWPDPPGSIVPDAGRRMGERLRATGTPEQDVEPLAELLAEDLAGWPEDAWLAFDDYQFASESPFAEEFVERVLALSTEALSHEP